MIQKSTRKLSLAEVELREVFDLLEELKQQLREIKTVVNELSVKAQISHSMLVVRKISEDKLDLLDSLLD